MGVGVMSVCVIIIINDFMIFLIGKGMFIVF